jgi:hypothetical protein
LVYFTTIWYIFWPFCIFCCHLVHFPPFWYDLPRKIWQPWPKFCLGIKYSVDVSGITRRHRQQRIHHRDVPLDARQHSHAGLPDSNQKSQFGLILEGLEMVTVSAI